MDWIIWRRTGEKHRCMLNIVCYRQSNHPKPAGVYVEHVYKLRHVVLVCTHKCVSMCVLCCCFVWGGFFVVLMVVFSFFLLPLPPIGLWVKTLNEIVCFHDRRMGKGLKTACADLAVWTLRKFNWDHCLKFRFCCARLRSYITQLSDTTLLW